MAFLLTSKLYVAFFRMLTHRKSSILLQARDANGAFKKSESRGKALSTTKIYPRITVAEIHI